jgi:hypothetical protein
VQNNLSEPFETSRGLWQRDDLACILFNTRVALEKEVIDSGK